MNKKRIIKNLLILTSFVFSASLLTVGCSSDDDGGGDNDNGSGEIPTISSFTPSEGVAGSTITVTGTNFANVSKATINNVEAEVSNKSNTSLTITVPDDATSGPIAVLTSGNQAAKTAESFVVIGDVILSAISPNSGEEGSIITVTGEQLSTVSKITVGEVEAEIQEISDTEVTFKLGDSPLGVATIEVTTDAGTGVNNANEKSQEFSVYQRLTRDVIDLAMGDTFDDEENPSFSSGGDSNGEVITYGITDGSDFSNLILDNRNSQNVTENLTTLAPKPIDGNYYYVAGVNDLENSGSYIAQIGNSTLGDNAYGAFFDEGNDGLDEYYLNIQLNWQGVGDYTGVLGECRLRFDQGSCGKDSDEFVVFKFVESELKAKGFDPNEDGWYSVSVKFSDFVMEKCSDFSTYDIKTLKRFNFAGRKAEGDGEYSFSVDNFFLSKGGPVYTGN